jgi:hypothetical protein
VLAAKIHLKERVVSTLRAENRVDLLGVHGQRDRIAFAAVKNGGDTAGLTQAARFVFAPLGAGCCFDYYFFLVLSHAVFPFSKIP